MFEGDLENGELEIGQISAQMKKILPAQKIVNDILVEFKAAKDSIGTEKFSF